MNNPKISVVLPAYNCEKFIVTTLDCLKHQIFRDFETVIINDGSCDNSEEIIYSYAALNPDLEIVYYRQKNAGIAGARNSGILRARGDYVAFLDHDDIWYQNKLQRCYEVICSAGEIDVLCHDEILRISQNKNIKILRHGPLGKDVFRSLLFDGNKLSTSATIVRKSVLSDSGLFMSNHEFSTAEDYELWLRVAKSYKFYFIPDVLGEYVINNNNASLNLEMHYNNQLNVVKHAFGDFKEKTLFDFLLYNIRISRILAIISKENFRDKKMKKGIFYLLKALLAVLSFS